MSDPYNFDWIGSAAEVPKLPVKGAPTTYIMEPDLVEAQTGKVHTPPDVSFDDAGFAYNNVTGEPVQIIRRPNVLPVARTPDGFTFAMPKMLDVVGNVMSPLIASKVPVKAGEVVLGSGAVRTMRNPNKIQIENLINKSEHQELRGLIDDSGVHVWDASKSTHHDTAKELGINYDINNRIHITKPQDEKGFYTLDFDDKWRNPELVKSNPNFVRLLNQDNILVNEPGQGLISGKDFLKLYSDTRPQVANAVGHAIEKQTGPFYSGLERAVETAKVNKADASQWLGYLKNQPGVKADEIGQVLKDLPQGPITKEQLQNIVQQNKVQLGEVVKGDLKELPEGYEVVKGANGWNVKSPSGGFIASNFPSAKEAENGAIDFLKQTNNPNPTKYHDYQLPGGENYQEMLLTLPAQRAKVEYSMIPNKDGVNFDVIRKIDGNRENYLRAVPRNEAEDAVRYGQANDTSANRYSSNTYKSSHWDEPNILAHVRYNDRDIPDVGKSLHLEEIQSDWHQAGRKQGYKLSDNQKQDLENIDNKLVTGLSESDIGNPDIDNVLKTAVDKKVITPEEATNYKNYTKGENSNIPDAPFKTTWSDLAFKRMLNKAATEGYDSISWTPGEAQAARYDLSKQVEAIRANKNPDGTYMIGTQMPGRNMARPTKEMEKIPPEKLADYVGKDLAEKIIKGEGGKADEFGRVYSGLDLKVGGEGMKSFYDKMLVDKANALAKKYGAKVETKEVEVAKGYPSKIQMRSMRGDEHIRDFNTRAEAYDWAEKQGYKRSFYQLKESPLIPPKTQPVHVLKLTPELKARAKQGFPLFSGTPILNPVDFNPFEQQQSNYKLVPVSGNPFGE